MSDLISEPVRSCVGCRQRLPQASLVRITRTAIEIVVDGPSNGRGAWLCRSNDDCLDRAIANRGFARAWRASVSGDEERIIKERIGLVADEDSERDGH